ncbi:MAG: T9SS type A sorting domain-containing protein [Schleiferiaceae bacterium]|jgi:hypothetical protein|nr:T9SS type A sorting domain-containing protein [Schleiferiaceae bacterium]
MRSILIVLLAFTFSLGYAQEIKRVETKASHKSIKLNTEIKALSRETKLYLDFAEKVGLLNDDYLVLKDLKIYPNPNSGRFTLEFTEETSSLVNVFIYDLAGNVLFSDEFRSNSEKYSREIDITDRPAGVYFLLLKQNNASQTQKIEKL